MRSVRGWVWGLAREGFEEIYLNRRSSGRETPNNLYPSFANTDELRLVAATTRRDCYFTLGVTGRKTVFAISLYAHGYQLGNTTPTHAGKR